MCLLIHKPAGKSVSEQRLKIAFENNEDGIGVAYVCPKTNDLIVDKGWMDLEGFLVFYKENNLEATSCMIHFRAASPGMDVSEEMCHPFHFESDKYFKMENSEDAQYVFAVAHNGKLPWRDTKKHSDTYCFVFDIIEPQLARDPYFFDYPTGKILVEKFVGDSNKICVYRYNRKTKTLSVYILNEKGGVGLKQAHWDQGCWFSNDSYKTSFAQVVTTVHYNQYQATQNFRRLFDPEVGNFYDPDANGWYWSFDKHKWIHESTGLEQQVLLLRKMPFYMRRWEAEYEKKATETAAIPGKVKAAVVAQESDGNRCSSSKKQGKEKTCHTNDLSYLSAGEQREFRRFCYKHMQSLCSASGRKEKREWVENMKLHQMLEFVRGELRLHLPHVFSGLSNQECDLALLQCIKAGCNCIDDVIQELAIT